MKKIHGHDEHLSDQWFPAERKGEEKLGKAGYKSGKGAALSVFEVFFLPG